MYIYIYTCDEDMANTLYRYISVWLCIRCNIASYDFYILYQLLLAIR